MARIAVRVQPRSSRLAWQVVDGCIKVWLTAPPEGGKANAQLCTLLAEAVGVPKTNVRVSRGHTSRDKHVDVDGLSESEVLKRLTDV